MLYLSVLALLLLLAAPSARALDFASTNGRYLVNNETQGAITMNGIWYSQSNSTNDVSAMDSLTDGDICRRDAALMAQLGINTIYVLAIDPQSNHDDCFSIFNSVGIYVMVTLRKEGIFMSSYEELEGSYTSEFLEDGFKIIDAVKDYENLLGFDLGVLPGFGTVTEGSNTSYADIEKIYRAMVRDMKEYIANNAPRPILVGATLHLRRTDEKIEASDLTQSHMYWFSCKIDEKDRFSAADYISFWNLGYWETDPVGDQNFTYSSLALQLQESNVPTWYSMYGVSDEADYVEYELRPELLNDTLHLYNSSSQIVYPNGPMAGGARFTWTNTNLGWKMPTSNWGIVITKPDGTVQLTRNYDRLQEIFSRMNTGSWLSGNTANRVPEFRSYCDAGAMESTTLPYADGYLSTLTIATDWSLPTRPAGVDALITSGVGGNRGQMVDVTVTTLVHTVKDSRGEAIPDVVLKPSKSESRTTTDTTPSPTSSASQSTSAASLGIGAKAGIGVGVGVGSLAIGAVCGYLLLRKRRARSDAVAKDDVVNGSDDSTGFNVQKAELATGPEVEKRWAELPTDAKGGAQTAASYQMLAEAPGTTTAPVELPVSERPVELSR